MWVAEIVSWNPWAGDPVRNAGSNLWGGYCGGGGTVPVRIAGTIGRGGGLDNKGPVRREAPVRKAGALGSEVGLA